MIDVFVGEIDPPADDTDWKTTMRRRVLSARRMPLRPTAGVGLVRAPSSATR